MYSIPCPVSKILKSKSAGWDLGREAGLVHMSTETSFSLRSHYIAIRRRGRSSPWTLEPLGLRPGSSLCQNA